MKRFYILDVVLRERYRKKEFLLLLRRIVMRCGFIERRLSFNLLSFGGCLAKSSQIRGVCLFSGRASGVYRYFAASRFVLKGSSNVGVLPGLQKLSW